jgi:hypothetical protein
MRYVLVGATATMALLGAATLGYAQAPDDKNKGPAAEGKVPAQQSPGKSQQSPGDSKAQPRAGAEGGKDQPKAAQQQPTASPKSTDGQQKATQERTTDRPKGAEGPQRDMNKGQKSTEQQPADRSKDTTKRTENPEQSKDRQKASEQKPADRSKATEAPQRDMDKQKAAQDRARDQAKSAEQPKQGERLKVSEQQRTSVRERLTKTRVEKTRVNISINIGTAVPRSVRLHTLPVAIVSIAPEYRGYSYIVLEDETIVIVNPRTYVIVDYIPVGTHRVERRGGTHLTLSSDQMRFVFRTVPRDRTASVRARLALGAEVPRDVELLVFPRDVVQRIPALDRYRYVVSGGEVIIVDPSDHEVILVIDE